MEVSLEQGRTEFHIDARDKAAALKAVKALAQRSEQGNSGTQRQSSRAPTERIGKAVTLEEALAAWNWETSANDQGDIVGLKHTEQKGGDEDVLFAALAPFVVSGSYIEARAGGELFRWRFAGGQFIADSGRLVYDADPSPHQVLQSIHSILYSDGPSTEWNADTMALIAEQVEKVIPRPETAAGQ